MSKFLMIPWCPKDALDGMQLLDPLTELAYRRILDLIYVHDNKLPDDPDVLAWATKTGDRWPEIRESLIASGKIYVKNGRIFNEKCDEICIRIRKKIAQRKAAGKASAAARNNNPQKGNPTVVSPAVATKQPTTQATETQRDANLTCKPVNPEPSSVPSGTGQSPPPEDLTAKIFGDCRNWLCSQGGMTDKHARSFLGKLRKEYDDAAIIDATAMAQRAAAQQPEAYIRKTLMGTAAKGQQEKTPGRGGRLSMENLRKEGLA